MALINGIKKMFALLTTSSVFFFLCIFSQKAEMTENDVVIMPGQMWHCEFNSLKMKKEGLVHKVFTIEVAHLAEISTQKKQTKKKR